MGEKRKKAQKSATLKIEQCSKVKIKPTQISPGWSINSFLFFQLLFRSFCKCSEYCLHFFVTCILQRVIIEPFKFLIILFGHFHCLI